MITQTVASASKSVAEAVTGKTAQSGYLSFLRALIPVVFTFAGFAFIEASKLQIVCLDPTYIIPGESPPAGACINDFHRFSIFVYVNFWSLTVSSLIGPAIKGGIDAAWTKWFAKPQPPQGGNP